ncbi:hypothetical protein CIK06_06430 [Plantactinospora sp. KBS50]|nr:hypothetical protein CIK06_06430 [Plantactinospora sp. KBS50]
MGDPSFEDLTARARIRDAAIRLFAERGIEATTIRDIAAAAGVSPGLVRHHFGAKSALRDACDAYVAEQFDRIRKDMFDRDGMADPTFLGAIHPTARLLQNYFVRSLMDGSGAATARLDEAVETGERWLLDHGAKSRDPQAMAAVLAFMKLGVFIMQDQLSRILGVDVNTPQGYVRMLRGMVDVTSQPLLTPEQAEQLHAGLDQLAAKDDGAENAA